MDVSSAWLSELEMEDVSPTMFGSDQWRATCLEDEDALDFDFKPLSSGESYSSPVISPLAAAAASEAHAAEMPPTKQIGAHSWTSKPNPPSRIIYFGGSGSPPPSANSQPPWYGKVDGIARPKNEPEKTAAPGPSSSVFPLFLNSEVVDDYRDQCSNGNNYRHYGGGDVAAARTAAVRSASTSRTPLHAHDHVMAERKRREKLSQRFISLSAIVPGLKKTDKASVLGDAIKYLKQLQERVRTLEEQTRKRKVESVLVVNKKSQIASSDENCSSSSDENSGGGVSCLNQLELPVIEAKVSDNDVLIRIHCEKKKKKKRKEEEKEKEGGVIANVLAEIEKLRLTVINSSVMPFGDYAIHVTVVAKMDEDFCMTVKDLGSNLRRAILKIVSPEEQQQLG